MNFQVAAGKKPGAGSVMVRLVGIRVPAFVILTVFVALDRRERGKATLVDLARMVTFLAGLVDVVIVMFWSVFGAVLRIRVAL